MSSVLIELFVMAYEHILILTKLIANLGQIENWQVSFEVEYINGLPRGKAQIRLINYIDKLEI